MTRHLSILPGVSFVVGVDPSEYFLEVARRTGGESIEYKLGDGAHLPVNDVSVHRFIFI